MKVREAMSREVRLCSPDDSIRDAARMMREIDAGSIPVGENDRLVGMLTDRDITVRAVAEGMGPETSIREVMTPEIHYCFEDEDIDDVCEKMSDQQIRRLPVLDDAKRLVGIVSLGDLARKADGADEAGQALSGIAKPGGLHSQGSDGARI